jgi:hypothetical protein
MLWVVVIICVMIKGGGVKILKAKNGSHESNEKIGAVVEEI